MLNSFPVPLQMLNLRRVAPGAHAVYLLKSLSQEDAMSDGTYKHTPAFAHERRIVSGWGSLGLYLVFAGTVLSAAPAGAEMSRDEIIRKALSAAPPQLADEATVVGSDGKVLKEGTGGFTCMLTPQVPTGGAPMCADKTWMPWADAWLNNKPYAGPERVGVAYMLAGDSAEGGASNTDPFAKTPTAGNQWVVEGPHIMLIVPDETQLSGIPDDPNTGGPYVMWKGTPFAHVMMPVAPRPGQRQVAEK
jgi:hypothetical protein